MTLTSKEDSWLKWFHLYLTSICTYLCLNIKNCSVSICRGMSWTQPKQLRLTFLREYLMSMLLFLSKVLSWVFERFWLHLWPVLMQAINCFPVHEKIKQFWHHQIYKHQNITSMLVFTIVFEIHRAFSLFYLFDWKFADLIIFLFYNAKCVHPKNWEGLRGFAHPSTPDLYQVHNLSSPKV